ncbi:PAAR domain-containing protein [Stenotrophomonas sp. WED208]|uniref:PAAR domain-containing protein n=1 Tax=Stenotrophomonas sp. WED208 TaxID=3112800 RepID=UPI0034D62214
MFIALGHRNTGGGTVITGSPDTDIDGMQVARIGDKAVCPLHKGVFPRVTGDGTLIIDGQAVHCQVGKSAAAYLEH